VASIPLFLFVVNSSLPSVSGNYDVFSVAIILSFQKFPINGILQYVAETSFKFHTLGKIKVIK
jgi:hypothetical protein